MGNDDLSSALDGFFAKYFASNPEFFKQASKFLFCFLALQASYLTWGYMCVKSFGVVTWLS